MISTPSQPCGGLRRRSRDGGAADVSSSLCAGKGLGNLFIGKISLQQTLVTMAMAIALATALLGLQGLRAALITLVLIWVWDGR